MPDARGSVSETIGILLAVLATTYVAAAMMTRLRKRSFASADVTLQPVSVYKPLHGDEPLLYENLRSFCVQEYPEYELLLGLHSVSDPAYAVARRLEEEFPGGRVKVIVDARHEGANPKVGNLINLDQRARFDWLVLADSDVSLEPDDLRHIVAPLANPKVGVVTCLYRAAAHSQWLNRLAGMFTNDWFAPSVRVSRLIRLRHYCAGATLAMRRDALKRIGGFSAIKNRLADDFWLGELTRQQGLSTVISPRIVTTHTNTLSLSDLWHQEVRWLRTTRPLAPFGFAFLFLTMTTPMAALACMLDTSWTTATMAGAGMGMRLILHLQQNAWRLRNLFLVPVRDGLLLVEWIAACFGRNVTWRGQTLNIRPGSDQVSEA